MNFEDKILALLNQVVEEQKETRKVQEKFGEKLEELGSHQQQLSKKQEEFSAKLEDLSRKQEEFSVKLEQLSQKQEILDKRQQAMQREMNERFDNLESQIKYAWQDIAHLEDRIKIHEREFHNVG